MKKSLVIGLAIGGLVVAAGIFGPGALTASGAEPVACATCHSMDRNVHSFQTSESSHRTTVSCSDCHIPHETAAKALSEKYKTSYRHIKTALSGEVPEEIRLTPEARKIVLDNCVRCHKEEEHSKENGLGSCLNCHSNDPHGERGVAAR